MDRTCVSTGRSPETSGPSSPECTDPQRWRPSRRQPPPRTGCPSCHGYSGPQGRHAMVVAHFFESGQRTPSTLGPSRERTANGRRSSAGQHRVHSCDRRKGLGGATSASARRSRVPHSCEPALPTETAREQSTRGARSSHPFGAGAGSQPSCGRRGQAVVRRTVPLRSLDDWLVPACYQ